MKIVLSSWADMKLAYVKHCKPLQFVEDSVRYKIWFDDEANHYRYDLFKDETPGEEQTDFETNYKNDLNKSTRPYASDSTPYVRVTEKTVGKTMQVKGFEITASADTVTNYDIVWSEDIELVGGYANAFSVDTPVTEFIGSTVSMKVVDKDNILGYGAGTVLTTFALDIPMSKLIIAGCEAISTTAFTLLEGLYIRISVDNQHATDTVYISGSMKYYH